ncbi:MAG: hypothetical protein WDZ44_00190, partial [Candidatus Spechtbacterales bacterium]
MVGSSYGTFYVSSTNTSSADVAELYNTADLSISAADIVEWGVNEQGEYGLLKTAKAYSENMLGIISTRPGILLGDRDGADNTKKRPVALSGTVPLKVTTENGDIKPGDPITSSSIPGIGMKATQSGRIVGFALGGFSCGVPQEIPPSADGTEGDGSGEEVLAEDSETTASTEESVQEVCGGIVDVFVDAGWWVYGADSINLMSGAGFFAEPELGGEEEAGSGSLVATVGTSVQSLALQTFNGVRAYIFDGWVATTRGFAVLLNVSAERIGSFATSFVSSLINGGDGLIAESSKLKQQASADGTGAVQVTTYSLQTSNQEILISGTGMLRECSDYIAGGASDCNEVAGNLGFTMDVAPNDVVGIVAFAPEFSALLDNSAEVRVLITPTDQVAGTVYVSGKSVRGFIVAEGGAQDAGSTFDWIIIARIGDGTGTAQLEQVFIEENIIDEQVSNPPVEPITEPTPATEESVPPTAEPDATTDAPTTDTTTETDS